MIVNSLILSKQEGFVFRNRISQLCCVSWCHQSLLFTNWCTI